MSRSRSVPIDVEIYDQKYSILLQAPLAEKEVREIAALVDAKMRDIAAAASTADSLRVAVLTALHLALELRELRAASEESEAMLRVKTVEWTRALEQVLRK